MAFLYSPVDIAERIAERIQDPESKANPYEVFVIVADDYRPASSEEYASWLRAVHAALPREVWLKVDLRLPDLQDSCTAQLLLGVYVRENAYPSTALAASRQTLDLAGISTTSGGGYVWAESRVSSVSARPCS